MIVSCGSFTGMGKKKACKIQQTSRLQIQCYDRKASWLGIKTQKLCSFGLLGSQGLPNMLYLSMVVSNIASLACVYPLHLAKGKSSVGVAIYQCISDRLIRLINQVTII